MIQEKSEKKRRWLKVLIWLGLIFIFLLVLRAVWGLSQKNQMAKENLLSSAEQLAKLTERQIVLRAKIERLKTARGVEEEIRSNFPVVKEGEQVINIVAEEPKSTTTATTTKSWWRIF